MSDMITMADDERAAVLQALQQAAQGQWPPAIEALRSFADDGRPVSTALIAMYLGNSGQAPQGIEYALRAVDGPIAAGAIAANYMGWTSGDAALRAHTSKFAEKAVAAGWNVDPLGQAQAFVQQGDQQGALDLLTSASAIRTPESTRRAWDELSKRVSDYEQTLRGELDAIAGQRDGALRSMREDAEAIADERTRVEALVGDTTSLLQAVAADNLAGQYAERAATASKRASRWTTATLVLSACAIAIATAFVLFGLAKNHDVTNVLSKAGLSLPLLALAAYLNNLGAEERRDARSWTHIELQIRTARPYLGNLSDELRDEIQAALALRFFPGQSQDPHGSSANDASTDEGLALVRALRPGRTSDTGGPAS